MNPREIYSIRLAVHRKNIIPNLNYNLFLSLTGIRITQQCVDFCRYHAEILLKKNLKLAFSL